MNSSCNGCCAALPAQATRVGAGICDMTTIPPDDSRTAGAVAAGRSLGPACQAAIAPLL